MTQSMEHGRKRPRVGIMMALAITGAGLVLAGCGQLARQALPVTPPTAGALKKLLPARAHILKTEPIKFPGQPLQDVVVSTIAPKTTAGVLGTLQVSTVSWASQRHRWTVTWKSPYLDLQQRDVPHGSLLLGAITSLRVQKTAQGALVGILDPASIGASTLWNDGVIVWMRPGRRPQTLWTAKGFRGMLADAALHLTPRGLRVTQEACQAVQALQHNGKARVDTITCTQLLQALPGKRIAFRVEGGHLVIARPTLTVHPGTTLIVWPSNSAAQKMVNTSQLELYGGDLGTNLVAGMVSLAAVDSEPHWTYLLSKPGTYRFAIVKDTVAANIVPADITVRVVR